MKLDNIATIAAAAALAFVVLAIIKKKTASAGVSATGATNIVTNALPGDPGWGWQYFTDGTAIGPDGAYYQHGSLIWRPTA